MAAVHATPSPAGLPHDDFRQPVVPQALWDLDVDLATVISGQLDRLSLLASAVGPGDPTAGMVVCHTDAAGDNVVVTAASVCWLG
jgi:Ser/Thr protein kinase RdoA (MazF antagonist)